MNDWQKRNDAAGKIDTTLNGGLLSIFRSLKTALVPGQSFRYRF
ncbi:hypothetical protein [Evansella sp. LMS18]|nr:hypothetical protein [Evansella sp. LMS18]